VSVGHQRTYEAYSAEEGRANKGFLSAQIVDLADTLIVPGNLQNLTSKGLTSPDITQSLLCNLCQGSQGPLNLTAEGSDIPSIKECQNRDRREHEGHDRCQFEANICHQSNTCSAGDQSAKPVREILSDTLAYDNGVR
jgi:hypothetical protein